jgi:hypothetical protein
MKFKLLPLFLCFFMSFAPYNANRLTNNNISKSTSLNLSFKIKATYNSLESNNGSSLPEMNCFTKALEGFYLLKQKGLIQKDIITVIDFSLSSTKKRLWVIDLVNNAVLFNTFVAHGINSGGEFANSFSNSPDSNKSSLGFYTTGETYNGKHGLSLKLDGLQKGLNSNARARAVVIHGADYANPRILQTQGYLGRSQGCPAIPENVKHKIIKTIKGKSCLFIYHPARAFDITSKLIS